MAIDNPQAVKFCNENIRVISDKLAQAYYSAKEIVDVWTANNMGTIITVEGGAVEDGAANDGRPVITGNDVTLSILTLQDLVASYEASGKAKLNSILRIAPNPRG